MILVTGDLDGRKAIDLLISLPGSYIVCEQKGTVTISSEEYVLEIAEAEAYEAIIKEEEGVVILEPFTPRGLSREKSELESSAGEGKLVGQIELDKEAGKYTKDSIISIHVLLNFDEDVEERFEKELERLFGDTLKYEKLRHRKYELQVNLEQLDILVEMEEVSYIADANEEPAGFVPKFSD